MRRGARQPAFPSAAALALGLAGAAALALGAGAGGAPSARADDAPTVSELTPSAEAAIAAGLDKLASLQNSINGCIVGGPSDKFTVASTSLSGLAFLAAGDSYDRGRYGSAIAGCVRYLLQDTVKQHVKRRPSQWFFCEPKNEQQGRMHSHGFAMLFLAQAYGTTPRDDEIRDALRGAVAASLEAQTDLGGWGYHLAGEPEYGEDEASVTITQIQALRAARDAGIYVPYGAIAKALAYVKKSLTSDGSCRYSLTMQGAESKRTSYELTAAAVSTLNASGIYLGAGGQNEEALEKSLGFLRTSMRKWAALKNKTVWDAATDFEYYGNFYAAQAMFQATAEDWEFWFPRVRQDLVNRQKDGKWSDQRNFGDAYATASALLVLQMPRRYLPIFQK